VGVPAAWIFAFLIVFGLYSIFSDHAVNPPNWLMIPAQVMIAVLCAGPLTTIQGADLLRYAGPAALSLVVTMTLCALGAWALHRFNGIDGATGLLATLAGGSSGMVLFARELKANVQFVALTQYLRLSVVVLTLPPLVAWLSNISDATPPNSESHQGFGDAMLAAAQSSLRAPWQGIAGAIAVGLVVWLLIRVTARWVSVPSPYLLISMGVVVVGVVLGVPEQFVLPEGAPVNAAYAIIGVQAGGTLTKGALRHFSAALPVILAVLLGMVAASVVTGWVIAQLSGFSLLDSYLATVPGGVYAVLAFAHDAGSDPLVTVVQVLRVILMVVAGAYAPTVIRLLRRRNRMGGVAS